MRPSFITNYDVARWSKILEEDTTLPKEILDLFILKEVCICGLWLQEELLKVNCPEDLAIRIQYTAGKLSFGRDPWEVHQFILEQYQRGDLILE